MNFIFRNDPFTHPMLKVLVNFLDKKPSDIKKKKFFFLTFYILMEKKDNGILVDDPLSFFYTFLFYKEFNLNITFWALEIYSKQVSSKTFKNLFRNIFFELLTILGFRISKKIIFPSYLRKNYYENKILYSSVERKSTIVHNIPIFTKPGKIGYELYKYIRKLKDQGIKIIIYAGSIQEGRDIFKFIDKLKNKHGYYFLIAGNIKGNITKENLESENSKYIGNLTTEEVSCIYSLSDFGLLYYDNKPLNSAYCAPVKIWEYLNYDLKIIGNDNIALLTEWSKYIDIYIDDINHIDHINNDKEKKHFNIEQFMDIYDR